MIQALLNKKVILITGKGGTGKSTLAAALAILGTRMKKRVLLAELDMTRPSSQDIFQKTPGFKPVHLAERLDGVNIEFFEALRAYLGETIQMDLVVGTILKNKVVRYFLESTPFAREIVALNTLYQYYLQSVNGTGYDLVVVDMPATGHARSILSVTQSVFGMFRFGPLLKRAREIHDFLSDERRVAISLVSLAEEMPVTETLEAHRRLTTELPVKVSTTFVNRLPVELFTGQEEERLLELRKRLPPDVAPRVQAVLDAAGEASLVARRARSQVARLQGAIPGPVCLVHELTEVGPEPTPYRLARVLEQML